MTLSVHREPSRNLNFLLLGSRKAFFTTFFFFLPLAFPCFSWPVCTECFLWGQVLYVHSFNPPYEVGTIIMPILHI